jgi:hypothetical protein
MKHPGHTYGGFVPAISERGMTPVHGRSSVLAGDEGGERAGQGGAREVLTDDGGVATRWRTGGNKQRRLELVARAKEGAKKLGREGMRCGEGRGGLIALL